MFLGYQQVTVGDTVLTVASFTIPVGANHVMLQAEAQNVRYTMDNTSAPDTGVGRRVQCRGGAGRFCK